MRISPITFFASPCLSLNDWLDALSSAASTAPHQPHSGENCRLLHVLALAVLRWPDDLLLHSDQPLPDLPAALSPSLSRWLAGKGYPCRHAFWTCFRTSTSCLLPA